MIRPSAHITVTHLGSDHTSAGDINGTVVGKTGVLERVSVHQVSGLRRELHGASSTGALALHHERVVISDKMPNESLRHIYWVIFDYELDPHTQKGQ